MTVNESFSATSSEETAPCSLKQAEINELFGIHAHSRDDSHPFPRDAAWSSDP
jgi:hypothetical protein